MFKDFVSGETLTAAAANLPNDALDHSEFARALLNTVLILPEGSVVGLQGPWGRGKTDVLARVTSLVLDDLHFADEFVEPIWINPWQYGTPDLLTPLVIKILGRIPSKQRVNKKSLWVAASSIIKAGINFGCKAATATIPGGGIFDHALEPIQQVIDGLFEAVDEEHDARSVERPDLDPVAAMGKRFSELIDALANPDADKKAKRVLICIDDLDRCLPDRQVAMLEAIRFLTCHGARACFLIALDPRLMQGSLKAHYQSHSFHADEYLDKLFHLRITLPAVATENVEVLINSILSTGSADGPTQGPVPMGQQLRTALGDRSGDLPALAAEALSSNNLRNPRVIERILTRIFFLLIPESSATATLTKELKLLLVWLAIVERWPEVRSLLQGSAPYFVNTFEALHANITSDSDIEVPGLADISLIKNAKGLRTLISVRANGVMLTPKKMGEAFEMFDWELRCRGL